MGGKADSGIESFGALLRRYRGRRGLTQEELAERAGLHAQEISQLERGVVRSPPSTTVEFLADALKLDAPEIFRDRPHCSPPCQQTPRLGCPGTLRIVFHGMRHTHATLLRHQPGRRSEAGLRDRSHGKRGGHNRDAVRRADRVLLALWLGPMQKVIAEIHDLLPGKLVIDPSNPVAYGADGTVSRTPPAGQSSGEVVAGLLPAGTRFAKAFGTIPAPHAVLGNEPTAGARRALLRDG